MAFSEVYARKESHVCMAGLMGYVLFVCCDSRIPPAFLQWSSFWDVGDANVKVFVRKKSSMCGYAAEIPCKAVSGKAVSKSLS